MSLAVTKLLFSTIVVDGCNYHTMQYNKVRVFFLLKIESQWPNRWSSSRHSKEGVHIPDAVSLQDLRGPLPGVIFIFDFIINIHIIFFWILYSIIRRYSIWLFQLPVMIFRPSLMSLTWWFQIKTLYSCDTYMYYIYYIIYNIYVCVTL